MWPEDDFSAGSMYRVCVSRKITVVQWFSGLTASITSLSALLSVVLVMGFVGPGIERITMSWPFVLLFLISCLSWALSH